MSSALIIEVQRVKAQALSLKQALECITNDTSRPRNLESFAPLRAHQKNVEEINYTWEVNGDDDGIGIEGGVGGGGGGIGGGLGGGGGSSSSTMSSSTNMSDKERLKNADKRYQQLEKQKDAEIAALQLKLTTNATLAETRLSLSARRVPPNVAIAAEAAAAAASEVDGEELGAFADESRKKEKQYQEQVYQFQMEAVERDKNIKELQAKVAEMDRREAEMNRQNEQKKTREENEARKTLETAIAAQEQMKQNALLQRKVKPFTLALARGAELINEQLFILEIIAKVLSLTSINDYKIGDARELFRLFCTINQARLRIEYTPSEETNTLSLGFVLETVENIAKYKILVYKGSRKLLHEGSEVEEKASATRAKLCGEIHTATESPLAMETTDVNKVFDLLGKLNTKGKTTPAKLIISALSNWGMYFFTRI